MSGTIGILGGTFDPPHLGHLAVADAARHALGLDVVLVVPAGRAPLRDAPPLASDSERVALTSLAFADRPWARVDAREVRRGGTSWSVDTAREVAAENPGARLIWILGSDQLLKLDRWRDVAELCRLVEFAVLARDGLGVEPPAGLRGLARVIPLRAPEAPWSSTAIRSGLKAGGAPGNGLPPAVAALIEERGLYRA
ncbi:MAG: nicotinate (nicotinamide) nucleotide adenylyltransferase [Opitutales bacterium]